LALIEVDVCDFAAIPTVPTKGGAAESIGRLRVEEEDELESLGQSDVLELRCRGEGLSNVVAVEGAPEAAVGMALGSHERMFARRRYRFQGLLRFLSRAPPFPLRPATAG
jgi:hypothetical protein